MRLSAIRPCSRSRSADRGSPDTEIHEESIDDPYTTPNGVSILAIAASNAARAGAVDFDKHSFYDGVADVFGGVYGTFVLPGLGTLGGSVAASYIANHIHASVNVSIS